MAAFGPPAETGRAGASLENDGRVRTHECRDTRRIPVGEPYAPVRLGVADSRRLRGSVQAVVLFAQIDPYNSYWVVWSRLDRGLRVGRLCVPEQIRVVLEVRHPGDRANLPLPDWQGVMAAAARDGREKDGFVVTANDPQRSRSRDFDRHVTA